MLLTRGGDGALVADGGAARSRSPAPPVDVVDTIGAGDAFSGGWLAWWSERGLGRDDLGDRDAVADGDRGSPAASPRSPARARARSRRPATSWREPRRRAPRRCSTGPRPRSATMVREWLSEPGHAPVVDLPRDEYRAQVTAWAEELAMSGGTAMGYPAEFGGLGDVRGSIAGFETLAFGDLSLLVKCGVQFGLFGGAVLHLGHDAPPRAPPDRDRAARAARLLRDERDRPRLRTCRRCRRPRPTTRRPRSSSSTRRTPGARKDYIGNAARDGRMAVVFAQLIVRRRAARRARAARPAARRGRRASCRAWRSRTAGRSSGSRASTTAGSRSTTSASRATRCSTATRRSTPTGRTRARSRTRPSASS